MTLVIAAALTLSVLNAAACSIPVFRYALDRWPADNYRLEISAADAKDEAITKFIRNFGAASALNLEIVRVPADKPGPSRLLRPHAGDTAAPPVWTGSLSSAALASLTNSPVGAGIVRHILAGDSAVWVLVESGDRAADDAAARVLEKRLRYLEQVAQLPLIDPNDPTSKLGPGPKLAVKFSLLRVATPRPSSSVGERNSITRTTTKDEDEAESESAFLAMLAGPKSGLAGTKEPWVAAVFGRGRVLGAWPMKGFGDEQIEEISLFLLGACSCQVKNLNPGWDLLLRADWDEELRAIGYPAAAAASPDARPNQQPAEPETVTISGGEAPEARATSITRGRATLLGVVTLMFLAAGGWAWRQFAR